jgi:hypothetical protein
VVRYPLILNPLFELLYYNGGSENGDVRFQVENALNTSPWKEHFHASKAGKNFDLVLRCRSPHGFWLHHFFIKGPHKYTAPIKNG